MIVFRRFKVREHERGLLFRDRVFERILGPGRYWFWDPLFQIHVDFVSVRASSVRNCASIASATFAGSAPASTLTRNCVAAP